MNSLENATPINPNANWVVSTDLDTGGSYTATLSKNRYGSASIANLEVSIVDEKVQLKAWGVDTAKFDSETSALVQVVSGSIVKVSEVVQVGETLRDVTPQQPPESVTFTSNEW